NGVVAAVEVVDRISGKPSASRFYRPDWEPFPDSMNTMVPDAPLREEAPGCLDEVLAHASRIGAAFGTYMRIDFFPSGRSCVFNEFSSGPAPGRFFTPYCDELFGALWAELTPGAT